MSRRTGPSALAAPTSSRQNEYFVPRDGIDREVITADICRYLGNDALVRPGTYENPSTGQVIQGYFINAYRNLTTAMIEDLKADSARWDQERRQHSAQRSSTAGVQYRNSETHSSRQYFGPSDNAAAGFAQQQDHREQYDNSGPRYPGTGSAGYNGASSGSFQPQGGYAGQPGYGAPQNYPAQSPPHQQQTGNMPPYAGHSQAPPGQFQPQGQYPPYQDVGANSMVRPGQNVDTQMGGYDQYPSRDPRDPRGVPVSGPSASRPGYASSGPPQNPGYQSAGAAPGFFPPPGSSSGQQPFGGVAQPHDPFYGRGGYPQDAQQYEGTPAPSRTPTSTTTATQVPPPMAPSSTHRRERDSRESVERADTRQRHPTDRHTADRHRPRGAN